MFRKLLLASCLIIIHIASKADEGMWIPSLIGKNYIEMQKLGLKLTVQDIYDINKSSLKDAVVQLGKTESGAGFCTGEFISPEGLMLTNHHCGFGSIQYNSSVEHDYLTNGFWAKTRGEELPDPGICISVLVRIEDVTTKVMPEVMNLGMNERVAKVKEIEAKLVEAVTKGTTYNAQLKEMFYGNQYFLYVYEKYTDVRLVGAPPQSIGKFGGDTDNWMWPRHTADFSMFRVYMSKDGKPAPYSKDNVPYKPKHFLPISLKGISEKDYSMILGFPGRTNRYASSIELQNAININNPNIIKIYGKRLEVMKAEMAKSPETRIKLAAKYASMSNGYKYYIGQTQGLKKLHIVEQRKKEEEKFMTWVNEKSERKAKYGKIFQTVDSTYKAFGQNATISQYATLAGSGAELTTYAFTFNDLYNALVSGDSTSQKNQIKKLQKGISSHFKDYSAETDKKLFREMLMLVKENLPQATQINQFKVAFDLGIDNYTDEVFSKTLFTSKEKIEGLLKNPTKADFENDPAFLYATKLNADYRNIVSLTASTNFSNMIAMQKRLFIAGLMEMQAGKNFYPDANSSMRITYGRVAPYHPADAISFGYYTTTEGLLEKEDPTSEEFTVPAKLKELILKKEFGPYKDKDGQMHVAFISNNDITGGNSGSPVMNAQGELIGAAFDGNWEAMTGDLIYDPKFKRTISVDIRYVLFLVDKFAGATNLIGEMKLVK